MSELKGRTAFITGGSRGIGKAIGIALAKAGCNVVIAAKTTEPHPKLEGTIHTSIEEIQSFGAKGLAIQMDVRYEDQVEAAVQKTVDTFGGIDILINNASAIQLTPVSQTAMKRYDLMHSVNVRGTYMMSKACLPYLVRSDHAHILNLSPPINLNPLWFGGHLAYTMSKYGMSMCVLGMSEEFKDHGVCVNALWPQTTIATAAVKNLLGGDEMIRRSRKPEIVADAAVHILEGRSTGQFFIDEDVLRDLGIDDLSSYAVDPSLPLMNDIFLDS
jgi:citronellol/citronellal dehydrogenase